MTDLLSILDDIGQIDTDEFPHDRVKAISRLLPLLLNSTDSLDDDDLVAVVLFLNQEIQSTTASALGPGSMQVVALLQVGQALMTRMNKRQQQLKSDNNNSNNTIDDTLLGELTSFLEAALLLIVSSTTTSNETNNNNSTNDGSSSSSNSVISSVKLAVLRMLPSICIELSSIFSDDNDKRSEREQISSAVVKAINAGLRDRDDASVVIMTLESLAEILLSSSSSSSSSPLPADLKNELISTLCEVASSSSSSSNNNNKKQQQQTLELFQSAAASNCLTETLNKLSGISPSIKKLAALLINNNNNNRNQQQQQQQSSSPLMVAFLEQQQNIQEEDDEDDGEEFMKMPQLVRPQMLPYLDHQELAILGGSNNNNNMKSNTKTTKNQQQQREAEERDLQDKIDAVIRSLKQIPLPSSNDDHQYNNNNRNMMMNNNNNNDDITNIEKWHLQGLRYMQQQTVRIHMRRELLRMQDHEKQGIANIPVGQLLTSLPSCGDTLDVATQLHDNQHLRSAAMTTLVTQSVHAFPTVAMKDQPRCAAIIARLISKLPFHCVDRVLDEILETLAEQIRIAGASASEEDKNTTNSNNNTGGGASNTTATATSSSPSTTKNALVEGLSYAALANDNISSSTTTTEPPFPSYRLMIQLLYSLYSQLATSSHQQRGDGFGSNTYDDEDHQQQQKQQKQRNEDKADHDDDDEEEDENDFAFEQDIIVESASELEQQQQEQDDDHNTSDDPSLFFGNFNLKNPISWLFDQNSSNNNNKSNNNNRRRQRSATTSTTSSLNTINFQEDTYKNATFTSLGHATRRFLNFIFELAAVDLRLGHEEVQHVMTQVLLDLPCIPTSAWLFLHVHLCSEQLPDDLIPPRSASSSSSSAAANLPKAIKPMFLCVNGLGILSNIASARHSDTWKALSFLLHYTRSKKEFPRDASCLKMINLVQKLREDDNGSADDDAMMMMSFSEKIFLRRLIGRFALFSAQSYSSDEHKELLAQVSKQFQLQQLQQQQQEKEKEKEKDPSGGTSSITTTNKSSTSSSVNTSEQHQLIILNEQGEILSRCIALAASITPFEAFVSEDFFKFLLNTYAQEPSWRAALINSKEIKGKNRLIDKLCDRAQIDDALVTVREHYPPGSEPFISHLLSLIKDRISKKAREAEDLRRSGKPEEADKFHNIANQCAIALKTQCDNLVQKSQDVRFWCHAAAFHSIDELRQQTIPAIISCFESQETIPDAEAGLKNCVYVITKEDLLEYLIVVSSSSSSSSKGAGIGGGSFSSRAQNRAISAMIDLKLVSVHDAQEVLRRLRTKHTTSSSSTSITSSTDNKTINDDKSGLGGSTSSTSSSATTTPLFMRTLNLLLSRAPLDNQLRSFASGVARNLVVGEVWTHDGELWREVQNYLEQETHHQQQQMNASNNNNNNQQQQQASLNPNQQHILVVLQSMPRRILKDLCSQKPLLRNFVRQYQPELRDFV